MENNNNGRGVFYGVIGVATLIVAIIGATFAYFAAQTNTNDNAVRASAAKIELDIATHAQTNLGTNMIPVEADGETESTVQSIKDSTPVYATLFPRFPSDGVEANGDKDRDACEDMLGNRICSIYTFTVSNPSTASQQIYGFLTVKENGFSNLKYAVFKGTPEQVTATLTGHVTASTGVVEAGYGWNVLGANPVANVGTTTDSLGNWTLSNGALVKRMTSVPTTPTTTQGDFDDEARYIEAMTVTLGAEGTATDSVTYTVLLWIEETGKNQTTSDSAGGHDSYDENGEPIGFEGGIFINTGGSSGVTATLSLS